MSAPEHVSRGQVEGWLAQLEQSGTPYSTELLEHFWRLGPKDREAVPPLLATLRNEGSRLRAFAARWLGSVGDGSAEVAKALSDALLSEDAELRECSSMAIGMVGYVDPTIRARLAELLRSESEIARMYAAFSLLQLAPNEPEALELLRAARASSSVFVRNYAGYALVCLHGTIPSAIDDAIRFLDDDYDPTVEDIARRLVEAPPEAVIPRLLQVVRDGEVRAKAGALLCLSEPGLKAHEYRDEMIDTLVSTCFPMDASEADPTLSRRAANVAECAGLDAPVIVARLRVLLASRDDWLAEQAAEALLSFSRLAEDVRREAETTLERIWPARSGRHRVEPLAGDGGGEVS